MLQRCCRPTPTPAAAAPAATERAVEGGGITRTPAVMPSLVRLNPYGCRHYFDLKTANLKSRKRVRIASLQQAARWSRRRCACDQSCRRIFGEKPARCHTAPALNNISPKPDVTWPCVLRTPSRRTSNASMDRFNIYLKDPAQISEIRSLSMSSNSYLKDAAEISTTVIPWKRIP